ncbi:related to transcription regulatory protein [Rhynchosporium secalis]|uniref:Related to transcription regulatory protein n=1 Tax=Rhynchosporium secalis TaxID=38038 RepID=A0A1E1MD65_RHYSE|nr:related to transcription regulatory protein [Rhynchosporium secalis]
MNSQNHGPPVNFDRDRDIEDHRSQRALQEEMLQREQREREHNERQERERQHREQYQTAPPHQNSAGSIPLHQPVASRLPGAIHSPGGLLANHGGGPPSGPLGAPSGPGNAFGGPLHGEARPLQHNPQQATSQLQQQQGFGPNIMHQNSVGGPGGNPPFGGPLPQQQAQLQQQQHAAQQQQEAVRLQQALPSFGGPIAQGHQMPSAPALGQPGQQPILNDALSYLDQVKVQFADQPDVYNRFLDIMKDFKSQAIDTPGVINRVSELFAGNPQLIQGFNTFLPPGYRIECGAGNDPNTIRVTTPMGTTVQSISGGRALPESVVAQGGGYYNPGRTGWQQQQPQHSIESPEAVFSPQAQGGAQIYNPAPPQNVYENVATVNAHQQQQRGVSQLTNAAATLGHPPRNAQTPTPGGQPGMNNGAQPGGEKRGPVEFNHAISYVNKIKNRFQDKPEIYKQFLEILQTYQRESKPIQGVYGQVTELFKTAPDLLDDFKQFLPESAAQAKAAAAAKVVEDAQVSQTPQAQGSRERLPPIGSFAVPASTSKEGRKRPRNSGAALGSQANVVAESSRAAQSSAGNKRTKLTHKSNAPDAPAVSPTLTPMMPEPLPPTSTSGATAEELAFFDRVKKYIGNKSSMNEFLKLCNLFSQDLIDKNVLVHKASSFIGGNQDLMNWFKDFVTYDGQEDQVDNKPKAPTGVGAKNYLRIAHGQCAKRALDDLHWEDSTKRRKLSPKLQGAIKKREIYWDRINANHQERQKPCSGRDEMCQDVLNDSWASHPTWASEDSGFVAHRKNIYEEGLHRIEEERHDYDFNIEANAKVIQLLEPIAQSLIAMNTEERENFRMPIGAGGASQAIYKRVLKKVYAERGPEVVADLFRDPSAVLPIVLMRLKQKDEEWRFAQREWEKVWAGQTSNIYLKSLDHMGIQAKQADKKNFSAKHLIDAIKAKYEEQRRQRSLKGRASVYQFSYEFADREVVLNVLHIMLVYVTNASQHNPAERIRISNFFEKFLSHFFDISDEDIARCSAGIDRGTPDDDSEDTAHVELTNGRGRRAGNGKKTDLRRGVLDKARNGVRGRGQKDDSAAGSKESTPDADSVAEDDQDAVDEPVLNRVTDQRWTTLPGAIESGRPIQYPGLSPDQQFKRDWYSLYANQTLFVFFSVFQTLYRRFKEVKDCEDSAREEGTKAAKAKPAKAIGLITDFEDHTAAALNDPNFYYNKTLENVAHFIEGDLDDANYQGWFRRYYLKKGWQLYTIQDLLKHISRLGAICSSNDIKEKTPDLLDAFYQNRKHEETSFNTEINMRKQADKYVKEQELFLIKWYPNKSQATLKWVQKEETTFEMDDMERKERWQYYNSSYVRVDATEGVPRGSLQKSLLKRNRRPDGDFDESISKRPLIHHEELNLRIEVNTYKIIYREPGTEYFFYSGNPMTYDPITDESSTRERLRKFENVRTDRFKEKFEMNNAWMKGLDRDEVAKINNDFRNWIDGSSEEAGAEDDTMK